ncbi:hypothetical protein PoB_001607100 [Plakobranchus ocellatus]|uniref:Uncharacterized protein n=1 Tax=Plakobranchus ocellatus TaxID=259542 RepID=A0AAV3Z157_9GAST|nr:hypothetical protein PoB_001607100 [Plakobranchus ocellatus]
MNEESERTARCMYEAETGKTCGQVMMAENRGATVRPGGRGWARTPSRKVLADLRVGMLAIVTPPPPDQPGTAK